MRAQRHYVLIGQTPVEEPDLLVWARWFETADRVVADPRPAERFLAAVIKGERIDNAKDPVAVLRSEMGNLKERWRDGDTMARVFKAWNAQLDGRTIKNTNMGVKEAFPHPRPPMTIPEAPGRSKRVQ